LEDEESMRTWKLRRIIPGILVAISSTLAFPASAEAATGVFNVRDFGARGDGVALDSAALNKAIKTSAAAGGGTVYLPAGTYLSGTLHLKSNVTLWIDSGATILGSPNLADYASSTVPTAGVPANREGALIEGRDLERVALVGNGRIDGNKVRNVDNRCAEQRVVQEG
jgi:polygalacturonase